MQSDQSKKRPLPLFALTNLCTGKISTSLRGEMSYLAVTPVTDLSSLGTLGTSGTVKPDRINRAFLT